MHNRSDPSTLVPAARALAERGTPPHDVVRAIYGVDLPHEAWLLARDLLAPTGGDVAIQLDVLWGTLPWELMIPLDRGGPKFVISPRHAEIDAGIYRAAPELIALGRMGYRPTEHSNMYLAYSIDELRAGRTTVLACPRDDVDDGTPKFGIIGTSLLEVLRTAIVDYLEYAEGEVLRGDGDASEVEATRAHLALVDRWLVEIAS